MCACTPGCVHACKHTHTHIRTCIAHFFLNSGYNDAEELPSSAPSDGPPTDTPPPPPSSAMPLELVDQDEPLGHPPWQPDDTIPGSTSLWQSSPSTHARTTAMDAVRQISEGSSPTSSAFGTPSKADFLRSLDLQSREEHPRALDQLALQSLQLSKEERSSANDIAKDIVKSSKNPGASRELPSKEEPVDIRALISASLSSRKSSASAGSLGSLAGESDRCACVCVCALACVLVCY